MKRTMTRAVVRKSSLEDDGWFIDRPTDWWEEEHDKMTTSAHLIPLTFRIIKIWCTCATMTVIKFRTEIMIETDTTPVPHILLEHHGQGESYSPPQTSPPHYQLLPFGRKNKIQ